MLKEEALKEVKKIQQEYEKWKNDKDFISNEKQVCESLIKPFVKKVLGWNTSDFSEFKVDYSERGKRMDMLVCLDGISQFVIEAKSLTKDIIENREYYNQAINYVHSKDKTFAILTNFKQWIVLRCDITVPFPERAQIGIIDLTDFEQDKFEKLVWNFNKEEWIKKGKENPLYFELANLQKKRAIGDELLGDMKKWRLSLLTNLRKYTRKNHYDFDNEKDIMHVEEEIQRFIDRLIFICYCEDKELNEPRLKSYKIDKYNRFQGKPFLLEKIRIVFNDYREEYNSDLFSVGMCDGFYFDDSVLYSLLEDLREPKGKIPYDFAIIEVDILGRTYENFIGHLIKGKKRFKEEKSNGKRKEEGIYYTPDHIVHYIVNHTLKEYIKNKSYEDIKKIRILDPACGSGSFLIKVFDVLVEECARKIKRELSYEEKQSLLLNCIYGVDKDERACDIAKLSLSLKLAEKGKKLPELHNNIRNGDSLIEDKEIVDYLAFDWKNEFKEIMESGGFDVIIGNPPYVFTRGNKFFDTIKHYIWKRYPHNKGKINLYGVFLELSLEKLLKLNGYLGFITPETFIRTSTYSELRRFIGYNFNIKEINIYGIGVFDNVTAETMTLIVNKSYSKENIVLFNRIGENNLETFKVKQIDFKSTPENRFIYETTPIDNKLFELIKKNSIRLGDIVEVRNGIATKADKKKFISNTKINKKYQKLLESPELHRYGFVWRGNYINYDRKLLHRPRKEETFLSYKIMIQRVSSRLICAYDEDKYYTFNSINNLLLINPKFSLKYILCILNSKLMDYYYRRNFSLDASYTITVTKQNLDVLPIKNVTITNQEPFIKLVDKILALNKQLNKIGDKNPYQIEKIEKEINDVNQQIDKKVYGLYGLTDSEIKIVEDSLK